MSPWARHTHILPRGRSLWDVPVELVDVELWPTRARRCCWAPLSALLSVLQMGNLRSREGQPPALDTPQQGQGWEARAGSRTARYPDKKSLTVTHGATLRRTHLHQDGSKEHLHRGQGHPPRRPCISGGHSRPGGPILQASGDGTALKAGPTLLLPGYQQAVPGGGVSTGSGASWGRTNCCGPGDVLRS